MGQQGTSQQQPNSTGPGGAGNTQIGRQKSFAQIAVWIGTALWISLLSLPLFFFVRIKQSVPAAQSVLWIVALVITGVAALIVAWGVISHARRVVNALSQANYPGSRIWLIIWTQLLFGTGIFHVVLDPQLAQNRGVRWVERFRWTLPWTAVCVPLIIDIAMWDLYLTETTNQLNFAFLFAGILFLLGYIAIWQATRLRPAATRAAPDVLKILTIIQTIATVAALIIAALDYFGPPARPIVTLAPPTDTPNSTHLTQTAEATLTSHATFTETLTPSPVATVTISPTSTASPTATPTPTVTIPPSVTAGPTLVVLAPYRDYLRAGPHTRHKYIFPTCLAGAVPTDNTVIIIEQDGSGQWFHVRMVQAPECDGWLQKNQLVWDGIQTPVIPTASHMPTNPPPIEPTPPRIPRPTCAPHEC